MSELKFTEDHEWIRLEDDGTATVGITDYAQEQLGDVVYVELPEVGRELGKDDEVAVVESVKAAGEIKMPLSGTVLSINESLEDEPETVNADPEGNGWFMTISVNNPEEVDTLMDDSAYNEFLGGL
ncbi:MAG: glycine cleavage system protein GcvH [Gammaproteobacteria bacterium]|nr:MAG: glycine cleavage system protein GcvH [Gammaproteobacteria bacterium]